MINKLLEKIFQLSRFSKIIIQLISDTFLILFCFCFSIYLRLENFEYFFNKNIILYLIITIILSLLVFLRLNFYNKIIRFISDKIILNLSLGVFCSAIFIYLVASSLQIFLPRSVPFIYFAMLLISMIGIRFFLKNIFLIYKYDNRKPLAIYGAGEAGRLVLKNLQENFEYEPIFFIDDDQNLRNSQIDNIKVLNFENSLKLIKLYNIQTIIFAISNISINKKKIIINKLEKNNLEVKVLPEIQKKNWKKIEIKDFSHISIEEILQREEIPPKPDLIKKTIFNKTVLVTGCGGSIGSELCRQVLKIAPKTIICLDNSEFNLHKISEELKILKEKSKLNTLMRFELVSVNDIDLLKSIFTSNQIDTIYHAAAYKHVPIVESNILAAIKNNIGGTLNLVKLAYKFSIKNFILISSDKAVRPTNIMGATKRVAELICQSYYQNQSQTKYSIVRFGNVIGSSGSVIPIFRKQIKTGGPITVTSPKINRYFMTINEAVGLVIQSSAMGEGKDIFVLDMGKPIKILDLACRMARLMGFKPTLKKQKPYSNTKNIRIEITGLRPGEKLYEELLISKKRKNTSHPRIYKAFDKEIDQKRLKLILAKIDKNLENKNIKQIKENFKTAPIYYKPV